MVNLKELSDYIKRNKLYNAILGTTISGKYSMPIVDYGYVSETKEFWFFCSSDENSTPVTAKTAMHCAYKYPNVNIIVACEEANTIKNVTSMHTERGCESFGEPDIVVLDSARSQNI